MPSQKASTASASPRAAIAGMISLADLGDIGVLVAIRLGGQGVRAEEGA